MESQMQLTEVIEAAKAAHVHHFIKTLPNSYDMVLNEETSNISAGQKQLLNNSSCNTC